MFRYGLAIGLLLVVLGGLSLALSLTFFALEVFVVCAGVAIILGAFGSTATLNIPAQGLTMSGVAVIALVVFHFIFGEVAKGYVRIKILGGERDTIMNLIAENEVLGAYQNGSKSHDFVIFGARIDVPYLRLIVTLAPQAGGDDERHPELKFECIPATRIKPLLASTRTINWRLVRHDPASVEDDRQVVTLVDTGDLTLISDLGPCREASATTPVPGNWFWRTFAALPAFAQESRPPSARQLQALLKTLESDVAQVRRTARSELAAFGPPVVRPLMSVLARDALSYRLRLGALVALTEMMRAHKDQRQAIIEMISEADLERLIEASADADRTIRIYASEFLYDLGDPRAIDLAFREIGAASVNGRYNLLLVIQGAAPHAAQARDDEFAAQLKAIERSETPKTNQLIEDILRQSR